MENAIELRSSYRSNDGSENVWRSETSRRFMSSCDRWNFGGSRPS